MSEPKRISLEDRERPAFEHWMSDGGEWIDAVARNPDGSYRLMQTSFAWAVWLARAALDATQSQDQPKQVSA